MTFPGLHKHLDNSGLRFEAKRLFELFEGTQIDAFQTTIGQKIAG